MRAGRRAIAIATILLIGLNLAAAESNRRPRKQEPPPPPPTPADKRDRAVAAPGSPFNGKAYWQAAAQCGGIYFRISTVYAESAVRAKVIKPDPAAYTQFTKDADGAGRTATAFFDVAERFLAGDRKLSRDEAVVTYDRLASETGDRLKSIEAAQQAAKPCLDLYKTCRGNFPQICNDIAAVTH